MKVFIALLSSVLISQVIGAQCTAYLNLGGFNALLTAEFVAEGAANPQYIIDWGDGSIDTASTPFFQHEYASEGQYVLLYTYQDLDDPSCVFYSYDSVIISGGACSFDFNVQTISLAAQVQAFSFNTAIPIYTIDWGDGSPTQQASTALHAYEVPGIYVICVEMYDADPTLPCELFQCEEVEITGNGTECPVNLQVISDNMSAVVSITANGGATADYFIDWGDGSFSANPVVEHNYADPGAYEVCVYYGVNGDIGCQSTACEQVVIDPFSDCYFDFVATVNALSVELQVLAAGIDNPSYFIDWGDGIAGESALPPTHTYAIAGTYEICGLYSDTLNPAGCQLSNCISVTLTDNTGGCNVELSVVQSGNEVQATALGTGALVPFYTIDWGDGSLPLFASVGTHAYSAESAYEICVTYGDSSNAACSVTTCETIVITDVNEGSLQQKIRVWPNPMRESLLVHIPDNYAKPMQLRLLDSTGRIVLCLTEFSRNIDGIIALNVESLSAGVYMLEFTLEHTTETFRLLK